MFNLGEKVEVMLRGEITEIRKIGCEVRYTITGEKFQQAYVHAEAISFPAKEEDK